jgi:hypothetical protein
MGNLIEEVFNSIDKSRDFEVVRYTLTIEGQEHFYLLEQSPLQILRELPSEISIEVIELLSDRGYIQQKVDSIKDARNVLQLLDAILPLVKNGSFQCKDLTILIGNTIELQAHDDGEVHLKSGDTIGLRDLLRRIFIRQGYDRSLLDSIVESPNFYHKLEKPDRILASYITFEEVLNNF